MAEVPDIDAAGLDAGSGELSQQVQVINELKEFTPELGHAIDERWGIADLGFDYNVVAVFGSQSTGKSTLLNRLFSTQFDVMDESARQQTTKGIWICKARGSNTLVMDVEGTDGRERGEDQDFERKSALFSLSVAEVLIVNMWEQSVGLYNGANMGLLKTVFEVNLQLFQKQNAPKTCIFFVLRDFTSRTPLEKLAGTLINDLKRIWDSLVKPAGKEDAPITDFFDFEYVGVPHKIYAPEGFDKAVSELRERFYNRRNAQYVFKPVYHKRIPVDGFPHFAASIWEQIQSNRDLDLPTQQELLAQFRCDEISKGIYERFLAEIKPLRQKLDVGKVVDELGEVTQKLTQTSLEAFDKDASRYAAAVYKAKRADFATQMYTALSVLFVQQLRNLHKTAIKMFNDSLAHSSKIKGDESEFAHKLQTSNFEAEAYFKKGAEAAVIPAAGWTYDEQLSLFTQELTEECNKQRKEAMARLAKKLETDMTEQLQEPIKNLLTKPTRMLWPDVLRTIKTVTTSITSTLRHSLEGFEVEPALVAEEIKKTKIRIWDVAMETVKSELADKHLLEKLRESFESKFRYDERGIPRFWSPSDDIDGTFAAARTKADELLTLVSEIKVPLSELDPDVVESKHIKETPIVMLSVAKQEDIRALFNREAHGQFVDAKRSTVATEARIPPWFIVMTIALGWNEILIVLFNPMLALAVVAALALSFLIWKTGMTRPLFQVARVATGEVTRQVQTGLEDRGISINNLMNNATLKRARHSLASSLSFSNGTSTAPAHGAAAEGEAIELKRRATTAARSSSISDPLAADEMHDKSK
ncbi:Dynamin-like GTPase that mediates homotypic ER fusion [Polyrhizophydium stewartii]|uniref:Dynamin-like GTPase that mediates homotypic ER fusion n=1 Tax=Polyrhizophydium stewartii TaxID=2732419 RepID=A0ABR4NLH9_9FUNG